ncbi:SAM-dependent methyltransferase [Brevundimonas alba]|uniref:SAM-dependent methyltransferase n=1 Tax=Brevundimonas alba TaxID=74314 RepID=A0A7X5YIS6_9CAUL|nr:class I SAM-dependent methyltransferase [Brevundimonas alba]NJC40736.1 SAM-dependent methyltransferase [Brevundimonas alba]
MDGPADEVIDLYSRRALDWDADRGKALIEKPWLDAFLAEIPPEGSILDLGCGSGEPIARYLIEQGRRITGVDAAPGLIDLCRRRFPGHDWRVGDMRGLDLGRTFDGLIAWHSAFHLRPEDQSALFAVYARHVAPGGVLMFTSGTEEGEVVGAWRGEPLYHGSLSAAEYRRALDAAGFDLLQNRIDDAETGGATVWLARARLSV